MRKRFSGKNLYRAPLLLGATLMLSACGLGIAMENGSPAALRAARLVTRPNVTAGVAYAVNAFLDGRLDLLSPGGRA